VPRTSHLLQAQRTKKKPDSTLIAFEWQRITRAYELFGLANWLTIFELCQSKKT
jgi:hypothetical protein